MTRRYPFLDGGIRNEPGEGFSASVPPLKKRFMSRPEFAYSLHDTENVTHLLIGSFFVFSL